MAYQKSIKEVIAASEFVSEPAIYRYYLVRSYMQAAAHLKIIHNRSEITVVTSEENEHLLEVLEANPEKWRLLRVRCGKPFYCVGFIAGITHALAEAGIDITIASTFEYDLLLVQEENLQKAIICLKELGFRYSEY
ncbi:MAG: hypothetical protein K0S33_3058 [Bacteroidetes bacterium]|jgi:hypothetical protein|nr:hypothetical protein [Bacteroidota bacterium]